MVGLKCYRCPPYREAHPEHGTMAACSSKEYGHKYDCDSKTVGGKTYTAHGCMKGKIGAWEF